MWKKSGKEWALAELNYTATHLADLGLGSVQKIFPLSHSLVFM